MPKETTPKKPNIYKWDIFKYPVLLNKIATKTLK